MALHSAQCPGLCPLPSPGTVMPVQMGGSLLHLPRAVSPLEPCHPQGHVTPCSPNCPTNVPPCHGTTRSLAGTWAALCKVRVVPISPRRWVQASPATVATSQADALVPIQEGKKGRGLGRGWHQ